MRKKKHWAPSFLGRLLSNIPQNQKWLFPFYQAGQLSLTRETYVSASLPSAWDGLNIAFCSDIHFGPMFSKQRALMLFEKMNALNADLMLLGGDYGETTQLGIELFDCIPRPSARLGVFASIGNHDLKGTDDQFSTLIQKMENKGIMPLQNASYTLSRQDADLIVCATDDIKLGKPDLRMLTAESRSPSYTIFFPHSPDILPAILKNDRKAFDLALCGHTHGGQLTFCGHSLRSSSKYGDRYRSGWIKEQNHSIFVSNGVGTSLIPVRLGAPPQYHLITLRKA